MRNRSFILAILLGIGAAAFTTALILHKKQAVSFVPRPSATGEVGWLSVYAQVEGQAVRLQPSHRRSLQRPQDLSFQFDAEGTGPRHVRIELVTEDGRRAVVHEERFEAPIDKEPLGYLLRLDDTFPDALTLIIAVEAPHSVPYQSKYPLRLVGFGGEAQTSTKSGQ